jgi:hypothetical protein
MAEVKRYNISKPKKYVDRNGQEKTQWNNIGTITEFHKQDGSVGRIIEIPAIGLEANIFPFQERGEGGYQGSRSPQRDDSDQGRSDEEVIDINDVPF